MSYEKQTWQNGDTITAEKLNHMEDGINNSSQLMVVGSKDDGTQLNKTWKQIRDHLLSGGIVVSSGGSSSNVTSDIVTICQNIMNSYTVTFMNLEHSVKTTYTTDNEDGYPARS